MVKADAYGHGMIDCARTLEAAGVAAFGVADVIEGIALREAGVAVPVYVLAGILPETAQAVLRYDLTPVIVDGTSLEALDHAAARYGKPMDVHLKLDAGMGRQGVAPEVLAGFVEQVAAKQYLQLAGILAHFPMADALDTGHSEQVLAVFNQCIDEIRDQLPESCRFHIANSGGLFRLAGSRLDMVRPGISLYGYYADGEAGRSRESGENALQPVMRFTSRVLQVREVKAGVGLGYNHLFTTDKFSRIALIPVGYEDGYLRCLSNRAEVLIHGRRAPVVGRISMSLTMIDVTGIGPVQAGDEVVLLGRSGREEINADEIARWMQTISYEVLCLFGKMNERYYIKV